MKVHVIWDNSNIWLGGKDTCEGKEPSVILHSFRIHFDNLYHLVLNNRIAGERYFGGSVPPECEPLWDFVKNLGCQTNLLHRIEKGGEQAVDEVLHLKMANLLLDINPPEILAVLSGNGHTSDYGTSFPEQIKRALQRNWQIEIYSWECSMSHKIYDSILNQYPTKAKYIKLDDYYYSLTFIKEKAYQYSIKGQKQDIYQEPRRVQPLKGI